MKMITGQDQEEWSLPHLRKRALQKKSRWRSQILRATAARNQVRVKWSKRMMRIKRRAKRPWARPEDQNRSWQGKRERGGRKGK